MVPKCPGWSVPSATAISGLPPKSNEYLFPPKLSTFITSVSLLFCGFSFQSPTSGSLAAHATAPNRHVSTTRWQARFSMQSTLPFSSSRYPRIDHFASPRWPDSLKLTWTSKLSPVLILHRKKQVCSEEGQNLVIDSAANAPIRFVKRSGVLFSTVSNAKFIQLAGKGLVGIDVVIICIIAGPVKLETS